ncbi:MAG: T9SS type A sorting domain-containing protein [Bacteroidia bacterium]|nr:T9SS type A sorting domain-containing protein [Bacteroidia bacterium]
MKLDVRANTTPEKVGSVQLVLKNENGQVIRTQVEINGPYALGGNVGTDFTGIMLTPGKYTLEATPFSEILARGTAGQSLTVNFEVRDGMISGFTLVNADTDSVIAPLKDGDVIFLSRTGRNLDVIAQAMPEKVGSVRFELYNAQGELIRTRLENTAPYVLGGNTGMNYNGLNARPGKYTLKATPFTGIMAQGRAGQTLTVNFEIKRRAPEDPIRVTIYPNPALEGYIYIECVADLSGCVVQIFDDQGNLVIEQELNEEFLNQIDISRLKEGIYIIKLLEEELGIEIIERIVIE